MDFFEALWLDIQKICGNAAPLGTNNVTTLGIIVWSLFIGFMIAIAVTAYNKFVLGPVVSGLIEKKAHSEDTALVISDFCRPNPFVRFALRKKSSLRRIIMAKEADGNISRTQFYIPEDKIKRATVMSGSEMSVSGVLLSVLVFFALALAAFIVVPDLITMASNFVSSITPKSNII